MFSSRRHRLDNLQPKPFTDFWELILAIAGIALIAWTYYPYTIFKIKWNRNATVHVILGAISNDTDSDYTLIIGDTIYKLPAHSFTKCVVPIPWAKSQEAGWIFDRYAQYSATPQIAGPHASLKINFKCHQAASTKKRLPKKMLMRVELLRNSSLLNCYIPLQTLIREIGFYNEQQYELHLVLAGSALQHSSMRLESC